MSRAASMFPPETMQTSLRPGTRPESAAASASAPAPSAITRARSARRRTAAAVSSSETDLRAGEQRPGALPHRRQDDLGARAVDEGRREARRLARLPRRERGGDGCARLGLDGEDAGLRPDGRERARDPGEEAAAAPRHEHRVGVRQLLCEFEPDRPVAGDDAFVLHRMDEEAVGARRSARWS